MTTEESLQAILSASTYCNVSLLHILYNTWKMYNNLFATLCGKKCSFNPRLCVGRAWFVMTGLEIAKEGAA